MRNKKTEREEFIAKRTKAIEIGKLLPETKEKVKFYADTIEAEHDLISAYEQRQGKMFVSKITKAKEKAEIIKLKNSVAQKQKVYTSYLERKTEYEKWLDEMMIEVNANYEQVLEDARNIPYASNPRLQDGINRYESFADTNTIQDKIEMYLFMKSESMHFYSKNPNFKKEQAQKEESTLKTAESHLKIERNEEAIS